MDKSLTVEYSEKKRWCAYEIFVSMKYEQADSMQPKYSQQSQKEPEDDKYSFSD